ncbi:hypothetical protein [Embleya sp. MST-111070]|uniref:hypothetical protein n=1 Tax=Embleya sp. MST-111070 TaxID=3398231 RepID=UPI003F7387A5
MKTIDTDNFSAHLRTKSIRPHTGELLIARIDDSDQATDLSEPPNCAGFGRIRHFRVDTPDPWPGNPLPILPAAHSLGVIESATRNAQVFQNASCNWRCWYCFVPFDHLAANESKSAWLTADQMISLYRAETSPPIVIDCSGGQPDLIPEWIPWMMDSLVRTGLHTTTYLWSDDNLSNDYFWRHLDSDQRRTVTTYRNYGRVGCFKGFDARSFAFNTRADPTLFTRQFELFARLLATGIDLYAYATFTAPDDTNPDRDMADFVDRLQEIHPTLPLRTVPLRIETFGVVQPRLRPAHRRALEIQDAAIRAWNHEIERRFDAPTRALAMPDVPPKA